MFKGVDGPSAVTFNFAGTADAIPETDRPQLLIDFTDSTVVPEPASLALVSLGLLLFAVRASRSPARRPEHCASPIGLE